MVLPKIGPICCPRLYLRNAFSSLQNLEATPQMGSFLQFWALLGSIFIIFEIGSYSKKSFLLEKVGFQKWSFWILPNRKQHFDPNFYSIILAKGSILVK